MLFLWRVHPDSQLDMPNFICLFASSSQLLYKHFALFSPDSPCLSSAFSLTRTISKSFLCPTKGLTFSCQQTFFSLSLSQQTPLSPPANVLALKAVVCHYLLIPVLSHCCAWSCSVPSSSCSFFNLHTKLYRTPAPPSLSKFLILLSSTMLL